jgi:HJR/Mrr/RecB family endonuclease
MNLSRNELLTQLRQIDACEFEELVADIWEHRGWEITVTTSSNDKGIDVITKKRPHLLKSI